MFLYKKTSIFALFNLSLIEKKIKNMGKLFATCDDITEMIMEEFDKTGLEAYGINLKIMSTKKA